MSDTTLIPEDRLKQINLKGNEGKTHKAKNDSIKIDIADTESNETKNINEKTNHEELAESANKQDKDTIHLEISKANDDFEKAKDESGKDYMVYGYYGRGQNEASLPTTWVQFQGGFNFNRHAHIEPSGAPLDYEPQSRNSFVLQVFTIVFVMLVCTAGFIAFVLSSPDIKYTFRRHALYFSIPAIIVMVGLGYAMACSPCARVFPFNILCLILAVMAMSVLASVATSRFNTSVVLYAFIATAGTVFLCMCLACTNFDFTKWLLYVVVIAGMIAVLGLMLAITRFVTKDPMKPLHLVLLVAGTLVNIVMITIELQMILGGKAVELGEDDYALGAYLLYTSIMDLFIKMVSLIGIFEE